MKILYMVEMSLSFTFEFLSFSHSICFFICLLTLLGFLHYRIFSSSSSSYFCLSLFLPLSLPISLSHSVFIQRRYNAAPSLFLSFSFNLSLFSSILLSQFLSLSLPPPCPIYLCISLSSFFLFLSILAFSFLRTYSSLSLVWHSIE